MYNKSNNYNASVWLYVKHTINWILFNIVVAFSVFKLEQEIQVKKNQKTRHCILKNSPTKMLTRPCFFHRLQLFTNTPYVKKIAFMDQTLTPQVSPSSRTSQRPSTAAGRPSVSSADPTWRVSGAPERSRWPGGDHSNLLTFI
jgi:hypothetical protein